MSAIAYPSNAKTFQAKQGHSYSYAHFPSSQSEAASVIFLHGFPSSSADWHQQIEFLKAKGHNVLALDLLGYGGSSKPDSIEEYEFRSMADEIIELVEAVVGSKAHFVSHDFGSHVLSRIVAFHPQNVFSATFLAVPFMMPGMTFDIEMVKQFTIKTLGFEKFAYMRFLSSERSWELIDEHPTSLETSLLSSDNWRNFYPPDALRNYVSERKQAPYPSWVGEDWTSASRRASILGDGYRGPTNWYRALLSNQGVEKEKEELQRLGIDPKQEKLKTRVMFIESAPSEASMPSPPLSEMFEAVTTRQASTKGHWIMLESPNEVNDMLSNFLGASGMK